MRKALTFGSDLVLFFFFLSNNASIKIVRCFLQAFATKYRLPFTLLSDEGNKVRKEWGVPSDLFGTLPGRQTYVLDRNGAVRLVYNNQFQPEKHVEETLKLLQSI